MLFVILLHELPQVLMHALLQTTPNNSYRHNFPDERLWEYMTTEYILRSLICLVCNDQDQTVFVPRSKILADKYVTKTRSMVI